MTPISEILPPQLPRRLESGDLFSIEDDDIIETQLLTGCDLSSQAGARALFEQVLFQRGIFNNTKLPRTRIIDCRFETCDLSQVVLEGARLSRVEFSGCRLIGAQWINAQLDDVSFKDCGLEGAVYSLAAFRAARFENCVLRNAFFDEADLTNVVFEQCDLSGAVLQGACLKGADLRGSKIGSLLVDAQDLRGAIIDPRQALQVVALLEITVKEPGETLVPDEQA